MALTLLIGVISPAIILVEHASAQTLDPAYEQGTGGTSDGNLSNCDNDGRTYCRRNCTSYVAYRLAAAGVAAADYQNLNDGGQWYQNASARGIPVGSMAKVGAAAVIPGTPGHVAFVESINPNGSINVKSYNGYTEQFYPENNATRYSHFVYFSNVGQGSGGSSGGGGQTVQGRMILLDGGHGIWAKDSMTNGGWHKQASNDSAKRINIGADTQVIINYCDAVWAKYSLDEGGWTKETECGSAKDVKVSSTGLQMILDFCGAVYAKKGIGYSGWTKEAECGSAKSIAVGGDRQVILDNCGAIYARDGVGYGGWNKQADCNAAKSVSVGESGLMALINPCDAVWAKGNNLSHGGWNQETGCGSARSIEVGSDTQVILDFCGAVYARKGIGSSWTKETECNSAKAIDVGSNGRQMILALDNAIWAKDGVGYGGWGRQTESNGAIAIAAG